MRKALFTLAAVVCIATTSLRAQTDSLNRELGFSTQILFDQIFSSSGSPFELMYKTTKAGRKTYTRYGLGVTYQTSGITYDDTDVTASNAYTYIEASVGKEGRTSVAKRWKIAYGGDVALRYTNMYRKTGTSMNGVLRQEVTIREPMYYGELRPFLGLMFEISPRLYINTEASFALGVGFGRNKYENKILDEDNLVVDLQETQDHTYRATANLQPASAIFVYYRF